MIVFLFFLILMAIIVLLRIHYENTHFKVTSYEIRNDKIPENFDGKHLVFLADMHNNVYGNDNQEVLDAIHHIHPIGILIAGDMVVKRSGEYENASRFIQKLAKDYPVYYTNGNHEDYMKATDNVQKYETFYKEISQKNVIMLNNRTESISCDQEKIIVKGLDLGNDYYQSCEKRTISEEDLNEKIGICHPEDFTILLVHAPYDFERYAKWGADLVLSGHNHGGMVYLPLFGGVLSTDAILFPKYDKGIFKEGKSTMILSGGLGSHTIKVRLFNRPEIIDICLKK